MGNRWMSLATVAVAMIGAGCGDDSGTATSAASEDLPPGVVAQVGDETIGKAEFDRQYIFQGGESEGTQFTKREIRQQTLDKLISIAVLRLEARRRGVSVPDHVVETATNRIRKAWGEKRYREAIASLNDNDFKRYIENGELLKRLGEVMQEREGSIPRWMMTGAAKDLPRYWKRHTICREGYESAACQG